MNGPLSTNFQARFMNFVLIYDFNYLIRLISFVPQKNGSANE